MTQTWEGLMKRRITILSQKIQMTSRKAMLEMELNKRGRSQPWGLVIRISAVS